jgi:ABC-type transport system involved in cytochrome bd biosynthesis fused ATPase/permease subunit
VAPDYDAVKHVLAAPLIAHRTTPYIGPDDFDFDGLAREAETMSGGEALLVRVARALWRAEHAAGLWEIARRLDQAGFERVLEALRIARGDAWGRLAA